MESEEELWNGKLCNKLANEYLLKNIKALSELFSGEINPTHILFPEGKFDYAEALYKDTFIFQYLKYKDCTKNKRIFRCNRTHRNIRTWCWNRSNNRQCITVNKRA